MCAHFPVLLHTITSGLPLAVTPDFATQSCQWSWGEVPLPPEQGNPTPCPVNSYTHILILAATQPLDDLRAK